MTVQQEIGKRRPLLPSAVSSRIQMLRSSDRLETLGWLNHKDPQILWGWARTYQPKNAFNIDIR
jgi:hypothetical protein